MKISDLWNNIIKEHAGLNEIEFLSNELTAFLTSKEYKQMLEGRKYYEGKHDILNKKRTMIAENGEIVELKNLPNNRIVDNQFDDLVDQKINYLLGNPLEVRTTSEEVKSYFNKRFNRLIHLLAKDALIGGKAFLHPYFENGKQQFKRMKPENVMPFWSDEEHENLDAFIYFYEIEVYEGRKKKKKRTCVEYYDKEKIKYYVYEDGKLTIDGSKEEQHYMSVNGIPYTLDRVPLVCFKMNEEESPLLSRVKCLQDGLNSMQSMLLDNMQEDARNSILVIKNYDGEDLSEFRRNLATYGAIKIRTVDGVAGDVDVLNVDVNVENYAYVIQSLKDSIIKNGRGFDAKDDRMKNTPNQMNIMSMYSDIDLDACQMELQFQAGLEELAHFINMYLSIVGGAQDEGVEFIFNKNTPVNEGEVIENIQKSVGILSNETLIANHPWTTDTDEELSRVQEERREILEDYVAGSTNE